MTRLDELLAESDQILADATAQHITGANRELTATCILFSGGNDSTLLAHLFRERATYAVHCNTGIGIEETRQFVRDTCTTWDLPLLEEHPPPGSNFRELVLDQGFPGPAHHWKMYQRLKERALRQTVRYLVAQPRRQRVIFLAGRRRDESQRRADIPAIQQEGSVVWVSPLVNWTSSDMNVYRSAHSDLPRNKVADLLHMSGECLCGSFAKPDELAEIAWWFPEVAEEIHALEHEVRAAGIPEPRCRWGWGHRSEEPSATGPLCSSCALGDLI